MKKKMLSYLSNGSLIIAVAVGGYAIADIFITRSRLPSGACPVVSNRPLLYGAVALCCLSLILSFFEPKDKK